MKRAEVGDTIEWTLDSNCGHLSNKTCQAEVACVTDTDYGVYADYGQDYIPFEDAKIIKLKPLPKAK